MFSNYQDTPDNYQPYCRYDDPNASSVKVHRQLKRPKVESREDIEQVKLSADTDTNLPVASVPSEADPVTHTSSPDHRDSQRQFSPKSQ